MSTPTIYNLSEFPASPEAWQACKPYGIQLIDRQQLLQSASHPGVRVLLCSIRDRVDRPVLEALPDLALIANYGAGVEHIDVDEARRRGLVVTNTPGVLSDSVADLTWTLILAVCRRVLPADRMIREGNFPGWTPQFQVGREVCGTALGLVGLGDIGEAVARRARGFDMTLLYHNRTRLPAQKEKALGVTYCQRLEDLLAQSDIVSLHTPLTPQTRHLMNSDTLGRMKPGSVLINTARGPVVDEAALVAALESGHLYGAGLDVFEEEPKVHPALLAMDNVVLTPHIGSGTRETRQRMGDLVLENVSRVLFGKPPLTPVP